jgi:hypothetical protein
MLISSSELSQLQRSFGPKSDEGQVYVRTIIKVRDGLGWKDNEVSTGPIPARVSFLPIRIQQETLSAGKPEGASRYLVELPADVLLEATDTILVAAPTWAALKTYLGGARVMPTTPNGLTYWATGLGKTGVTEPTWPTVKGNTVSDGTVTWKCAGPYLSLNIESIAEADPYPVTRNIYCTASS